MGYVITNLSVRTKLAILILGGSIFPAFAGTVFTVENVGAQDYLIDGQPDPDLELVRGETYIFDINAPNHPFWIKTRPGTRIVNVYSEGVTGNGADTSEVTFIVPQSAPDTLYYSCEVHSSMTGALHISDAPIQQVSHVLDGAGGTVSSASASGHISAFQPSPVGFSLNNKFLNSAGFLHSDVLAPASTDNTDGDGLTDWQEITGVRSSPVAPSDPNLADTDGDGIADDQEILSGTNPGDSDSLLRLVMMEAVGEGVRVIWQARGGRVYRLWYADAIPGLNTNATLAVECKASGGVDSWRTTFESYTNQAAGKQFFKVEVVPEIFSAPEGPL